MRRLTAIAMLPVLEQQFCNAAATTNDHHIPLHVSAGFAYAWDPTRPCGKRVPMRQTRLHGTPLTPTERYRVTANELLAEGGEGFRGFTGGTDRVDGPSDVDALAGYLEARAVVNVPRRTRIRIL